MNIFPIFIEDAFINFNNRLFLPMLLQCDGFALSASASLMPADNFGQSAALFLAGFLTITLSMYYALRVAKALEKASLPVSISDESGVLII